MEIGHIIYLANFVPGDKSITILLGTPLVWQLSGLGHLTPLALSFVGFWDLSSSKGNL